MIDTSTRIVGRFRGKEEGPLMVVTAAMHGNEPAGVEALDRVFEILELESVKNPLFKFKGELIGLIGNLPAYIQGKRYITKDINRSWDKGFIEKIRTASKEDLHFEDLEIREILDTIDLEILRINPNKIYVCS